ALASFIVFFFSNKEIFQGIWIFDRVYFHIKGNLKITLIAIALLINFLYLFLPIIKKDIKN
ncbi:hypothetical protein ACU6T2_11970, partial [Avibacterium paragallinarum]